MKWAHAGRLILTADSTRSVLTTGVPPSSSTVVRSCSLRSRQQVQFVQYFRYIDRRLANLFWKHAYCAEGPRLP